MNLLQETARYFSTFFTHTVHRQKPSEIRLQAAMINRFRQFIAFPRPRRLYIAMVPQVQLGPDILHVWQHICLSTGGRNRNRQKVQTRRCMHAMAANVTAAYSSTSALRAWWKTSGEQRGRTFFPSQTPKNKQKYRFMRCIRQAYRRPQKPHSQSQRQAVGVATS